MKRQKIDAGRLEHCACLRLRRAARAVTRSYDRALAPAALSAAQFTLLAALAGGSRRLGDLADHLVMERTTLTRELAPMIQAGSAVVRRGEDARLRLVSITPAGLRKLKEALPLLRKAQRGTVATVGASRYGQLVFALAAVTMKTARTLGRGTRRGSARRSA